MLYVNKYDEIVKKFNIKGQGKYYPSQLKVVY